MRGILLTVTAALTCVSAECFAQSASFTPRTRVAIDGKLWTINGALANAGSSAEGLLLNVRMVNATFEDRKRPDFDADANTAEFLAALPDYADHGVNAFTLSLQGGMPGYEGAINSAYESDGSLRAEAMNRIARVIEACDREGCVVILGCYYQRQDQILTDEDAVRAGVVNAAQWIKDRGYTNVVLEIANEYPHKGFDHAFLRRPAGEAALMRLAKQTHPQLLVSASGYGDGRLDREVCEAVDYLLIHFNGTPAAKIPERVAALKSFNKPIVCNEDDKLGETAVAALEASVNSGASWGFMHSDQNQTFPFRFEGANDDLAVYGTLKRLTTPTAER